MLITIDNIRLSGAQSQPPPTVDAATARRAANYTMHGATALRTILATVESRSNHQPYRAWVVIGCNVPYANKGGGPAGLGTAMTPVNADSGVVLFSAIHGNSSN
jgi:hypothetical protein